MYSFEFLKTYDFIPFTKGFMICFSGLICRFMNSVFDFYHSVLSLFSVISGDGVDLTGDSEAGGGMDLPFLLDTNSSSRSVKVNFSRP